MKKTIILILLTLLLSIITYIIFSRYIKPINTIENNTFYVNRVVDGDTFEITNKGKKEKVRLIGVDAPESVNSKTGVEYYGKEASNTTKKLIQKKYVTLEFDVQKKDKYGRLLAYVYLADGQMLNQLLLKEGYATIMTIPPNVKYSESFVSLQKAARDNRKGIWKKQ